MRAHKLTEFKNSGFQSSHTYGTAGPVRTFCNILIKHSEIANM